jgi:hypothetical protein
MGGGSGISVRAASAAMGTDAVVAGEEEEDDDEVTALAALVALAASIADDDDDEDELADVLLCFESAFEADEAEIDVIISV